MRQKGGWDRRTEGGWGRQEEKTEGYRGAGMHPPASVVIGHVQLSVIHVLFIRIRFFAQLFGCCISHLTGYDSIAADY